LLVGVAQIRWRQQAPSPATGRTGAASSGCWSGPGGRPRGDGPWSCWGPTTWWPPAVSTRPSRSSAPRPATARGVEIWTAYANAWAGRARPTRRCAPWTRPSRPSATRSRLRIARARLLAVQGHGQAAGEALVGHLGRLPADQRPAAWAAAAQLTLRRGDTRRRAGRWSSGPSWRRTTPSRGLMLLDLARHRRRPGGRRPAGRGLKASAPTTSTGASAGSTSCSPGPGPGRGPTRRGADLDEAERLTTALLEAAPAQPAGHVLRGLLREQARPARRGDRRLRRGRAPRRRPGGDQPPGRPAGPAQRPRGPRPPPPPGRLDRPGRPVPGRDLLPGRRRGARPPPGRRGRPGQPRQPGAARLAGPPPEQPGRPRRGRGGAARPDPRPARGAGPRLALLVFQVGQGRLAEARATIDGIRAEVRLDLPELVWAQCYRIARDPARAEELFGAAVRKWPDDPRVRQGAADFFEATGRPDGGHRHAAAAGGARPEGRRGRPPPGPAPRGAAARPGRPGGRRWTW
jgi:hypothetical protein